MSGQGTGLGRSSRCIPWGGPLGWQRLPLFGAVRVPGIGQGVGGTENDASEQTFDVVVVGREMVGQPFEEFGMAWNVSGVHLVRRVDDATSHQRGPHAIDESSREQSVVLGRDIGERPTT